MTASDHTPAPLQQHLRDRGHPYMTRYFHRELTRVKVCPAERVLGQAGDFSFRGFGEAELALNRKLSLPVSMMWQ